MNNQPRDGKNQKDQTQKDQGQKGKGQNDKSQRDPQHEKSLSPNQRDRK